MSKTGQATTEEIRYVGGGPGDGGIHPPDQPVRSEQIIFAKEENEHEGDLLLGYIYELSRDDWQYGGTVYRFVGIIPFEIPDRSNNREMLT